MIGFAKVAKEYGMYNLILEITILVKTFVYSDKCLPLKKYLSKEIYRIMTTYQESLRNQYDKKKFLTLGVDLSCKRIEERDQDTKIKRWLEVKKNLGLEIRTKD